MKNLVLAIFGGLVVGLVLVGVALADGNGVEPVAPPAAIPEVDLSIVQVDCDTAQIVASAPAPVAGIQAFWRTHGATITSVRDSEPLNDAVLLKYHVVSFGGYAAGNFPSPYGSGFPDGEFTLLTFDFKARGQRVQAAFDGNGYWKRQTIVSDPHGNDITGKLSGATLYPCS